MFGGALDGRIGKPPETCRPHEDEYRIGEPCTINNIEKTKMYERIHLGASRSHENHEMLLLQTINNFNNILKAQAIKKHEKIQQEPQHPGNCCVFEYLFHSLLVDVHGKVVATLFKKILHDECLIPGKLT